MSEQEPIEMPPPPEPPDLPYAPGAEDAPPKRKRPTTRAGRAAASAASAAKGGDKKPGGTRNARASSSTVAQSVQGLHEFAGGFVLPMTGMPMTGQMLAASGKDAGVLWAQLAKKYPAIERVFSGAGDGALVMQLLMVYAPVVMAAVSEKKAPANQGANPLMAMFGGGGMPSPEGATNGEPPPF